MKTGRELLELAAKAIGEEVIGWTEDEDGVEIAKLRSKLFEGAYVAWQPLLDNRETDADGDALRLAVMLGLQINGASHSASAEGSYWFAQAGEREPNAAARRAIVRAAAAALAPAPKLCDPCQQTGLMHCADPANCRGTP